MSKDLVRRHCKGGSEEFAEDCEFLMPSGSECVLLKDHAMQGVFEQGRCQPYEKLLKPTVRGILRQYGELINPEEYIESLTFEIAAHIKTKRLKKGWTICFLKSYINKTVYCETIDQLKAEGIILEKTCGDCVYLSRSKPTHCEREKIVTSEEEYALYNEERRPSQKACKQGFESYTLEPVEYDPKDTQGGQPYMDDRLEKIRMLLEERTQTAVGKKRNPICKRQYAIFCRLQQLLAQGIPRREAIETIAAEQGEILKTVYADIQEIKEFLQKKKVL